MNAPGGGGRTATACAWLALLPEAGWAAVTSADATLADATGDIRDIRGPKPVPGSGMLLAAGAAAIVVALCIYAFWRRRHRALARRTPTLSERTLERLEDTRPLMLPDTARAFGIAASEVIRDYIQLRFGVIATQRTTEEFLQALLQSPNDALARHRPLLAQFLQQSDFLKFAGDSLAVTDMEALFQSARRFVLDTGATPTGETPVA
jgi:hypothetical protein